MKNKRLYVVIPCYNEEEVLKETSKRLNVKLGELFLKIVKYYLLMMDLRIKLGILYVN